MRDFKKGTGLIELVFVLGMVLLFLTGIVTLSLSSLGVKNKNTAQEETTRMAKKVMVDLVALRETDRAAFWAKSGSEDCGDGTNFPDLLCEITYVAGSCSPNRCVTVGVVVTDENGEFEARVARFFSDK